MFTFVGVSPQEKLSSQNARDTKWGKNLKPINTDVYILVEFNVTYVSGIEKYIIQMIIVSMKSECGNYPGYLFIVQNWRCEYH